MTTLLTATADSSGTGAGALILLALVALAVYAVSCFVWPFRACSKCGGAGRFRSPSGRAWRYCRRCRGSGAKLRAGRRIWNHLSHSYDHSRNRGTR